MVVFLPALGAVTGVAMIATAGLIVYELAARSHSASAELSHLHKLSPAAKTAVNSTTLASQLHCFEAIPVLNFRDYWSIWRNSQRITRAADHLRLTSAQRPPLEQKEIENLHVELAKSHQKLLGDIMYAFAELLVTKIVNRTHRYYGLRVAGAYCEEVVILEDISIILDQQLIQKLEEHL